MVIDQFEDLKTFVKVSIDNVIEQLKVSGSDNIRNIHASGNSGAVDAVGVARVEDTHGRIGAHEYVEIPIDTDTHQSDAQKNNEAVLPDFPSFDLGLTQKKEHHWNKFEFGTTNDGHRENVNDALLDSDALNCVNSPTFTVDDVQEKNVFQYGKSFLLDDIEFLYETASQLVLLDSTIADAINRGKATNSEDALIPILADTSMESKHDKVRIDGYATLSHQLLTFPRIKFPGPYDKSPFLRNFGSAETDQNSPRAILRARHQFSIFVCVDVDHDLINEFV